MSPKYVENPFKTSVILSSMGEHNRENQRAMRDTIYEWPVTIFVAVAMA